MEITMHPKTTRTVLVGQSLAKIPPALRRSLPGILFESRIPGAAPFQLTFEQMSKGTLLIGGTGTGKSNVFKAILTQGAAQMTSRDIMLVFDSKGEFYPLLKGAAGAGQQIVLISSDPADREMTAHWNIYEELLCSATREEAELMAREYGNSFFAEESKGSQNPFFGHAAADLFAFVLIHNLRTAWSCNDYTKLNNAVLVRTLRGLTPDQLHEMIAQHADFAYLTSYIGKKGAAMTPMTLSVLAVLQSVVQTTLIGPFAGSGRPFSMARIHRSRGKHPKGTIIVMKYNVRHQNALRRVLTLMTETYIKEVLSGPDTLDNSFLILDELALVPVESLQMACNYGRSKGLKTACGIQTVSQVQEKFGEGAGAVMAGFTSCMAFRCVDEESRSYISNRFGRTYEDIAFAGSRTNHESFLIRDCDQRDRAIGEAYIDLPDAPPFLFSFTKY